MERRNERTNLAIPRLMMGQQLKFIATMKIQQRTTREAIFAQAIQLVQGEDPLDEVFTQRRIVQATILLNR